MTDPRGADNSPEPPGLVPFGDVETAIKREVELISERFPDTDAALVDATVRDVFAELQSEAEVETHLLALTRHRVYERLEERGHAFQPPMSEVSQSDALSTTASGTRSDTGLRTEVQEANVEQQPRTPSTSATTDRPA